MKNDHAQTKLGRHKDEGFWVHFCFNLVRAMIYSCDGPCVYYVVTNC